METALRSKVVRARFVSDRLSFPVYSGGEDDALYDLMLCSSASISFDAVPTPSLRRTSTGHPSHDRCVSGHDNGKMQVFVGSPVHPLMAMEMRINR
jgi:hypothetical protein